MWLPRTLLFIVPLLSVRGYLGSIPMCVDGFNVEEDGLDFTPWEWRQSETEVCEAIVTATRRGC